MNEPPDIVSAPGELMISGGATLESLGNAVIAQGPGSGTVMVTGLNSTWSVVDSHEDFALWVGREGPGTGTLTISNQGRVIIPLVNADPTDNSPGDTIVGYIPSGVGVLNVTTGGTLQGKGLLVGSQGNGTANISAGGTVVMQNITIIGRFFGGVGTINVDSGGTLTVLDQLLPNFESRDPDALVGGLIVGDGLDAGGKIPATGTLNINGGLVVSLLGTVVGKFAGSSGTVNINTGGILETKALEAGAGTAQVNFDGGTLRATANNPSFITGFSGTELNIEQGGLTIDSGAFTVATDNTSAFSGAGGLTKIGSGTLILNAINTYAGTTTIAGGTLQAGAVNTLPRTTAVTVASGGTLDLNNFNQSIGSLAGAGSVTLGSATFTTGNDNTNTLFSGVVSGSGGIAKVGTGTFVLAGANTYSGGTTISAGTLQLGNGGTSGSIQGNVVDNGTLAFNRSDTVTFPGVVSGAGSVAQIGSGTTILTANSPYTGGTVVNAGTLVVGDPAHPSAALSGGGPINVAFGATLGGFGSVTGSVTNDGTVAAGNATPGFGGAAAATFTITGALLNRATVNLASDPIIGNVLAVRGNYTAGAPGSTLVVNTVLNAGGPLSNQITDRLLVFGNAAGVTNVRVNGSSAGAFTSTGTPVAADGISLVQVAGASSAGAFTLPGGFVDGGTPFQYHLNAYGPGAPNGAADASQTLVGNPGAHWDFRLQSTFVDPVGPVPPVPEPPSPPVTPTPPVPPNARLEVAPQVPAYITAPTALFNAGFQDLDSLHRRLGEIRDDQIQGRGQQGEVFIRGYGSSLNYTSNRSFTDFGFNSSQDYAATQFGGNWIAVDDTSGTLRAGLAGTLGRLWFQPSAIDGASKGQFNTESLAGIVTWQSRAGWYVDAIVMGGMFDGQITTATRGETTGMNGTSVAASVEGGYPIPIGWQGLSLEPQLQLVYQHLDFSSRTDVDGIGVDLGSPNQGVLRGGARLTRLFDGPDGMLFTPYLKANVLQGIGGGTNVHLDNVAFGTGTFGTALQVGGGVTGTLTRNLSIYGDVAWQHDVGGGGSRGWAFNGGLRYAFGVAPAAAAGQVVPAPAAAPTRSYLVFFDWDKATLTDRARQIIAEAATGSAHVQLTRIQVNGYTDTSGAARYNQGLSVRRAEAVAAELVRDGVPRSIISIQGFGETRLLVPTGPGVREPQNRRVEIVLQ